MRVFVRVFVRACVFVSQDSYIQIVNDYEVILCPDLQQIISFSADY